MVTPEDVKRLAALARIEISDAELDSFTKEFDAVLAYVGKLGELSLPEGLADTKPPVRNVFRPDAEPHETGLYTERIAGQFPEREGDYLIVKQIIQHD